jgi:regulatory protein
MRAPSLAIGRPPKAVTPAYLERAALHYLERYASSADNLRRVLLRKARRRRGPDAEPDPGLESAIAAVVERVVRSGLVNDASFAGAKVSSLTRRGTSTRAMRPRLKAKGVAEDLVAIALADAPDDLALALRHAERKRLGPYRIQPDPGRRERDVAALCRAGFPYRVAARVVDGSGPDSDAT